MTESICADITCKLTDKGSVTIVDSFGNADNQVGSMLESFLNICKELFLIKCNFRKIDENRIVAFEFTGKDTGSGQPSGMTSHDLNDCNGFFIIINRSVNCNLTNSGCYIFGSTSESRCMVCQDKVIVDCLRDSDETDLAVYSLSIAGKLAYCIHGIISTDVEEVTDIVLLKFFKELRIDSVCQVFRKLVAAGTKIRSRCCLNQFKLTVHFKRFHIHHILIQETFDSVDHSINCSNDILTVQCFVNNPIKAGINNCGWSAGLSDDCILLHKVSPLV